MGRSQSAIIQQAYKLNLPPKIKCNNVPPGVIEYIKTNQNKLTVKQLAKKLGYTPAGIYSIAKRNGFSFKH